jgi:hypothetical protein
MRRFTLNRELEMIWSHPHEGQIYLLLAVILVGLLFLAFRFASGPIARSKAIIALRSAAIGIVILILLNPVRVEHMNRAGPPPSAIFLIDESRSMSLEAPISRAQAVEQMIRRGEAWLPADRRPLIQKYGFGRELYALSEPAERSHPPGDLTRLGLALEQLPARFEKELPFGVFVFSDGRSTDLESLKAIGPAYRQLGVPIHVVPVGDSQIAGDVAVQDIDAPRDARPGTRVPVRVTLRSRGYAGERTELSIRSNSNSEPAVLAAIPITMTDGEQAHELVIEADQAKGGLSVEVSPLHREAITANNVVPFEIKPRDAKLRVIYMEGSPLPEYRYIQDALEEGPNVTCVSMSTDNMHAVHPRLFRINDPRQGFPSTRKELLSYDVIICSDISLGAFTPEQLDWTVELVGKRGGGFVMIGGNRSFGPGGWDQTVWDGLIPVDMSGHGRGKPDFASTGFKVVVPAGAMSHPIWKIVDDPGRNREVLARMPAFGGTNLVDRLKPAAIVLGVADRPLVPAPAAAQKGPRVRKDTAGPSSGGPDQERTLAEIGTIFACQAFGRGRTFAMATDSTWAWGTEFETTWGEGDNRYFRKFWRNVLYWLTENRDGSSRRLRVETDKVFYRAGEPIQITARAYDDELAETERYQLFARLHSPEQAESESPESAVTDLVSTLQDKTYRGKLVTPPASEIFDSSGSTVHQLTLDVVARDGNDEAAKSSVELQVIDDPAEFRDPRPDHLALGEIARNSGGEVIHDPEELAGLLARHRDDSVQVVVRRSPLWDTLPLWFLVMGLLSAEWIIRRRKGLA